MLLLRNSAMVLSERAVKKIRQLDIQLEDIFLPESELIKRLIIQHSEDTHTFTAEKDEIREIYKRLIERLHEVDPSLERSAKAALQQHLDRIGSLEKKWFRAEKRNQNVLVERVQSLKAETFPSGGIQERTVNIIQMWLEHGDDFIGEMKERFDPLRFDLLIYSPQFVTI